MRVVMLAGNPLTYDGRVLRHAETLGEAGHDVVLLGVIGPNDEAAPLPEFALRGGSGCDDGNGRDGDDRASGSGGRSGPGAGRLRAYRIDRRRTGLAPRLTWLASAARRHLAGRLAALLGPRPPLAELMVAPCAVELALLAACFPADIYHANDLDTLVPASWAARLRHRPYIYDAHELYPEESPLLGAVEREARRRVEHRLARGARAVLTVNDLLAAELARRHGIARPVVVRNVPSLAAWEPAAAEPRDGTLRLLLHGSFVGLEQPGVDAALQAVAALPAVRLTLRGGVRSPAALQRRLAELRIADRVTLRPRLPGADALVRAAIAEEYDAGLSVHLPDCLSRRLATSSKVFEYLMAGLVVVAADQEGSRHILDERCARFFRPGDPADLARVLTALAADRPALRLAQRAARQRAESEFNWQRERRRLLALYE